MSFRDKLYSWIKVNRPDVYAQIAADGVSDNQARELLNRETGLDVRMLENIEDGCRRFLDAFKAKAKEAKIANKRKSVTM